jgi:hypothetical protein
LENVITVLSSSIGLNLHILLGKTESGRTVASIAEMANCQVEANTRKEALEAIQVLVSDRLSNVEVLSLDISLNEKPVQENPWTEFIGIFEGNADFADMSAQWQAERNQDTDEAI